MRQSTISLACIGSNPIIGTTLCILETEIIALETLTESIVVDILSIKVSQKGKL